MESRGPNNQGEVVKGGIELSIHGSPVLRGAELMEIVYNYEYAPVGSNILGPGTVDFALFW